MARTSIKQKPEPGVNIENSFFRQFKIYLSTNLYGSLSCDYVSKLLRNEAAQTQNPYVILIPY